MSVGAVGRLPAIAVKLNGVTAYTKPSRERYCVRFHTPLEFNGGCSCRIASAKWQLIRQKSMSSHAESISACGAVLLWPSIVAALRVARHGPDSSSAALSRIAARSAKAMARQSGAAATAASMALRASAGPTSVIWPRTLRWACGWTTGATRPDPMTLRPPIVLGRSICSPPMRASSRSSSDRSGLPGAYSSTGSLAGAGTRGYESIGILL